MTALILPVVILSGDGWRDRQALGQAIRQERTRRGLRAENLARWAGISTAQYASLEDGLSHAGDLLAMAFHLGVRVMPARPRQREVA